jgi:3-hydroxybutyryl-CoA dehydrogenase
MKKSRREKFKHWFQKLPLFSSAAIDLYLKIFATGEQRKLDELREIISSEHDLDLSVISNLVNFSPTSLAGYDLVIDLNLDDDPRRLRSYTDLDGKIVIVCSVKVSLAQMSAHINQPVKCILVGINALHTFINRSKVELSFLKLPDEKRFRPVAKELKWDYLVIEDRVGLITPRVITMIINEACYTLHEGTASMPDIDKAMKLGTNYPYGPFEWCDRIGIKDVYETLEAIWNDTHDERYKICPLLKNKYLLKESFYHAGVN